MSKVVFDASALLALLNKETGYEVVEKHLANAVMSTVNVTEVVSTLVDVGLEHAEARKIVSEVMAEMIPYDEEQAYIAAALKKTTKAYGLSLGDRACLALAKQAHLPVITADKIWEKISFPHKITIIR